MTESHSRVIIAGSGLAGLVCAADLAEEASVTLVERLPVVGGTDWEEETIAVLAGRVVAAGVTAVCGTQALRWAPGRLFAAGMEGGVYPADVLVVATGHRPGTAAESGIGGVRCGGVIPGPVAMHLLASGVLPGRRPVVLGDTRLACLVSDELLRGGAEAVIRLAPGWSSEATSAPGITLQDALPLAIKGESRVEALEAITSSGGVVELPCDALILAGNRTPYRNVDGALEDSERVVMAQCCQGEDSDEATERAGHDAASQVWESLRVLAPFGQRGLEGM